MKNESDVEVYSVPDAESERTSLVRKDVGGRWPAWRLIILTAITCLYVVGIMAEVNSPLLPALEEDANLGWNVNHSGLSMSIQVGFEALGHLSVAWLSDLYGGPKMHVFALTIISVTLGMIALQRNPVWILTFVALRQFVQGIVWPAVGRSMNTYLEVRQWEVGLCLIGLASRAGDLLTSELTGVLELHFGWRGTLHWIAYITLCATFAFCLVFWMTNKKWEEAEAFQSSVARPRNGFLASVRWANLKSFYSETDAWLILAIPCFITNVWLWGAYVATFSHSIYGASASNSALINGSFPLGQTVGLLVAFGFALRGGKHRRNIYVGCIVCCWMVAIVPILFLVSKQSFVHYVALSTIMGVATGPVSYLPVDLYCMHVSQQTGGYALYAGSVYCVSQATSAVMAYIYGYIRTQSEQLAFQAGMILAAVSFLGCGFCLTLHTLRNWDGALFEESKATGS